MHCLRVQTLSFFYSLDSSLCLRPGSRGRVSCCGWRGSVTFIINLKNHQPAWPFASDDSSRISFAPRITMQRSISVLTWSFFLSTSTVNRKLKYYVYNILCVSQNAPATDGGLKWLSVLWGVPVSVTQGQDSVLAGLGWRASCVMSVRTDIGTWAECRGASHAAVILLTLFPTSATRHDLKPQSSAIISQSFCVLILSGFGFREILRMTEVDPNAVKQEARSREKQKASFIFKGEYKNQKQTKRGQEAKLQPKLDKVQTK